MKRTDRPGTVLVVSAKPSIQNTVRASLQSKFGRILTAESVQGAKIMVERENVALMLLFTPLKDEGETDRLLDMAERRLTQVLWIVSKERYSESVYRSEGRNVFVLSYPVQMDQVMQTVNFLYQAGERFRILRSEQERLRAQLQDLQVISRVKCLMVERLHVSEEEAHRQIGKAAMNAGCSRRAAAERILRELEEKGRSEA